MRSCLVLISMLAAHAPRLVLDQAPLILEVLASAGGALQVREGGGKGGGFSKACPADDEMSL